MPVLLFFQNMQEKEGKSEDYIFQLSEELADTQQQNEHLTSEPQVYNQSIQDTQNIIICPTNGSQFGQDSIKVVKCGIIMTLIFQYDTYRCNITNVIKGI